MDMILPLTHGASVNLSAIPRRYLASASVIEAWSVTYTYNRCPTTAMHVRAPQRYVPTVRFPTHVHTSRHIQLPPT